MDGYRCRVHRKVERGRKKEKRETGKVKWEKRPKERCRGKKMRTRERGRKEKGKWQ